MKDVYENFVGELRPGWRPYIVGSGTLQQTGSTLRLVVAGTSRQRYTDAQLDDYRPDDAPPFLWQPPLRLTIRARFSHAADSLLGTAGFGFWNYPSFISRKHMPTLPRAIWFFFASPPSAMQLDLHTPGCGWKAATIDTLRPSALRLAPLAPLAAALMNIPPLYRALWPPIQRAVAVKEAALHSTMTDWHIYTIAWGRTHARFLIDGRTVLEHAPSPGGPLCFVVWVDNQYAIVKPWGRFGWGLLDIPHAQWLEVDWLAIERE